MRTQYFLFLLAILQISCSSESQVTESPSKWVGKRVIDKADLLSSADKKELEGLLASYQKQGGLELRLYTVDKLAPGQGIEEFSLEVMREFNLGTPGINNGAGILLSVQDKQAKVEVNYGMEWTVSVAEANAILQKMLPLLGEQQYMEAFKQGFQQLFEAGSTMSWDIAYPNFDSLAANLPESKGKIVQFKARGITRDYNRVPLDIQFSPDLYIPLKPENFEPETYLIFSNYMVEMVNAIIYREPRPSIFARVMETEPLQLQLLGIE